jgi:hypothetical protein
MPDQILKEVTHLGSTLAELATKQLNSVIEELGGPTGDGSEVKDRVPPPRVNAGTMAFNVLQLMSKAGALLTQLSEYDLVRRNAPTLTLRSSNPLTNLTLQAHVPHPYDLLVENEGNDELRISMSAQTLEVKEPPAADDPSAANRKPAADKVEAVPQPEILEDLVQIFGLERRRVSVTIPGLPKGSYLLSFTIKQRDNEANVLGKKSVTLKVLPAPEQHKP